MMQKVLIGFRACRRGILRNQEHFCARVPCIGQPLEGPCRAMATDSNSDMNGSNGVSASNRLYGDNSILYKVIPMVDQYLKEYSNPESKVVNFQLPDDLRKIIDFELGEHGMKEEGLLDLVRKTMEYSVHTCHPRFSNSLWSGVSPWAVAAQTVAAATSTGMFTYEMAPVYNLMEQEVVTRLNDMVGFKDGDGILAPGGSISNMMGLMAARYNAFPESKERGTKDLPQMVIFTSAEGHYSVIKSASTMGIGSDFVIKIKTDQRRKLSVKDLREKVKEEKDKGNYPLAVVATSGTTVVGAFDPLNEIADVCEESGIWLHVDGAWGGSVLMSRKHKHLVDGIHRADSVTWDMHKMLCVPMLCSSILLKQKGLLARAFSAQASYLFQKDKVAYDPSLDTGDSTIQGGRINDVLKFWLMWKVVGREGLEENVDRAFERAAYLAQQVKAKEGFELIFEPECLNVCFYYIPRSLRGQERTEEWLHKLSKVASHAKAEMVKKGSTLLAYQPLEDKPNFFRMITMAPLGTFAELDILLEEIEQISESMEFQ